MTYQGASLGAAVKDWLTSADRKAGDVAAVKTPDDASSQGWYVLYFMGRDNNQYQGVSGYYARFANSTDISRDDYETEEEYKKALKDDAEKRASEYFTTFVNGSSKDYDTFVSVMQAAGENATEQSAFEHAGLYSMVEEVAQWLHDSERVEGDVNVIYTEDYGAIVVYYKGNDGVYADYMSENNMRSEDYSNWEMEKLESYKAHKQWEMFLSKKISGLGG